MWWCCSPVSNYLANIIQTKKELSRLFQEIMFCASDALSQLSALYWVTSQNPCLENSWTRLGSMPSLYKQTWLAGCWTFPSQRQRNSKGIHMLVRISNYCIKSEKTTKLGARTILPVSGIDRLLPVLEAEQQLHLFDQGWQKSRETHDDLVDDLQRPWVVLTIFVVLSLQSKRKLIW